MSKAKLKISVKKGKSGTKIEDTKVSIVKNDEPRGGRLFQTKAKALIDIRTTRNGKPRIRHR